MCAPIRGGAVAQDKGGASTAAYSAGIFGPGRGKSGRVCPGNEAKEVRKGMGQRG